jgi:hypothetical protein
VAGVDGAWSGQAADEVLVDAAAVAVRAPDRRFRTVPELLLAQ